MSLALLFPGQGTQYVGMLPWLESEPRAAPVLAAMAIDLGEDWRDRLKDEAWSSANRVAQSLITGVALAAWQSLAPYLPQPAVVAGYSVGELAAFSVAGLFDATIALQLARHRAALMDACAEGMQGGLLSVSGASVGEIESQCVRFNLYIAIRISVDRCIVGGAVTALEAIAPWLLACGAELTPLRVHVASHTPIMAAAAAGLANLIDSAKWQRSQSVIVCNVDGIGRREPASLKQAFARQVDHTVEWDRCMTTMAERQPRCVLEMGPGTTLARMWAANFSDIPVRSVDEFNSVQAILDWAHRTL